MPETKGTRSEKIYVLDFYFLSFQYVQGLYGITVNPLYYHQSRRSHLYELVSLIKQGVVDYLSIKTLASSTLYIYCIPI